MARPIWTGSLGFGLVSVPVGLYAATEDHAVHFHQLERDTTDRIRYRRVNERTGEEVPRDRIVRAVDLGTGEYVVIEDDELEAISPERSRTIEIDDFVDLHQIDPVYFETTYYLAPRGDAAARAYALLRTAMAESARVGVALFVLRGRERVVAVRPDREVLALETMYFADEVRDPKSELPELPGAMDFRARELSTAQMLIETLSTDWEPGRYRSTYRQAVRELIERKRHGETVQAPRQPEGVAPVVDLMEALNASLEATRRGGEGGDGRRTGEPTGGGVRAGRSAKTATGHRQDGGRAGGRSRGGRAVGGQRGRAGGGGDSSRGPGTSRADRRGRRGPRPANRSAAEDDPANMTKAALMSRAAELGIAGRSKMGRDELEGAVRRATRRQAS